MKTTSEEWSQVFQRHDVNSESSFSSTTHNPLWGAARVSPLPLRVAAVQQHVGDPSGDGELLAGLGTLQAALDHLHLQHAEQSGRQRVSAPLDGTVTTTWPDARLLGWGCFARIMLNQWGKSLIQQTWLESSGFQRRECFPTHSRGGFTAGSLVCTNSILMLWWKHTSGTKTAAVKSSQSNQILSIYFAN